MLRYLYNDYSTSHEDSTEATGRLTLLKFSTNQSPADMSGRSTSFRKTYCVFASRNKKYITNLLESYRDRAILFTLSRNKASKYKGLVL